MGTNIKVYAGQDHADSSYIPTSRSIGSEWMTHKPSMKAYSPPAITNQWAMVQASRDITAYDDFAVSPVRCGEGKHAELFFGFSKDDFQSCETMDIPVSYQWFPHLVKRKAQIKGMEVTSLLSLGAVRDVLQMKIKIVNSTDRTMDFELFIKTLMGLNCSSSRAIYDEQKQAYQLYDLTDHKAFAMQSVDPKPDGYGAFMNWESWYHAAFYRHYNGETIVHGEENPFASYGAFYYQLSLEPGEEKEISFIHAMGEQEDQVREDHGYVRVNFDKEMQEFEQQWDEEIRAAFTPGNDRFSGHLPTLSSSDRNLKRMYDMSALTLLLLKRTRRMGMPAKVYATGMTGWTHCFLWDTQMSAHTLTLLDPDALKRMIEFWIEKDPSTFMATNYVTGEGEAVWYAINEFAMSAMIYGYLTVTGNEAWLDSQVQDKTIMEHFEHYTTRFMDRMEDDHLVNYGSSRNLLECVYSYAYKVPAFNATNVWSLRKLSDLLRRRGKVEQAEQYMQTAQVISDSVMSLYVQGKGYWNCKYPDGKLVPVKTCLDYNYIFLTLIDDMPEQMKEEMNHFFQTELMTDTWMHALSPDDPDTIHSMRTDHQDDGAFVSWPAWGLMGMLRSGQTREALQWIGVGRDRGIATVTLQGPWGQAYFHGGAGSFQELDSAMKAPKEYPYIERYVTLSGSMYMSVVIEELFGLQADWEGLSTIHPVSDLPMGELDSSSTVNAVLYNLNIHGKTIHATWTHS